MKILAIYVLLAVITLLMLTLVDVLSGIRVSASLHSLSVIFATTTLQETICVVIFLALPLIQVVAGALKRSR
ncbi:hypothetical protein P40081_24110 [Paenibacillus sp. FSL P4-0081]|jgi:hypothetical protein|uniref:hypothetical protein n=1 Tax=Paenibacillus sp. FSL P4-0081 TaxID=1536769 RepID=UPI0004F6FB51|nr:hypothetical protein [Paenibacillus sp. FSL P4-0081]AIQ30910.1 hypothetical protein P40081_24110 [Paenibacillus sp. FSL P4-0081]